VGAGWVDEAVGRSRLVELGEGHTGLNNGHLVFRVDLEDPIHSLE